MRVSFEAFSSTAEIPGLPIPSLWIVSTISLKRFWIVATDSSMRCKVELKVGCEY